MCKNYRSQYPKICKKCNFEHPKICKKHDLQYPKICKIRQNQPPILCKTLTLGGFLSIIFTRRSTMLKRKIYDYLLKWKETHKNECLIIKGARQVGKTFLIEKLFAKEYKSFIRINFYEHSEYKNIFEENLSAEEILKRITANIPNAQIIPGDTLLFLDEIQTCAKARTALKFLAQSDKVDVVATGSLLGLAYGQDSDPEVEQVDSVPVGSENQIIMYPLDFEEFLWALGYDNSAIEYLKGYFDNKQKVPNELNKKYEQLLREYLVVGGMPEVVGDFVNNKDFGRVQEIQNKILNSYEDDIVNHAKSTEKTKVKRCYQSIPSQLARENKKFKYSEVEKGSTSRKFADSIDWLNNANLVLKCYNLEEPTLPLNTHEKRNEFKCYIHDTGLLLAMYGFATKLAILNNTLLGSAKGGIYENFVAETLVKKGYSLHYYKPSDEMELEFIIEKDDFILPIEAKAGNSTTISLNNYMKKYNPKYALKLINGNIGFVDSKFTIPHYMLMFL